MKKLAISLLLLLALFGFIACENNSSNPTSTTPFPDWLNGKTFKLTSTSRAVSEYIFISPNDTTIYVDKGGGTSTPSSYSLGVANLEIATNSCTATTSDGAIYTFTNTNNDSAITIDIEKDETTSITGAYSTETITNQPTVWPKGVKTYLGEPDEENPSIAVCIMLTPVGMYYLLLTNWEYRNEDYVTDILDLEKDGKLFFLNVIEKTTNGFKVSIGTFVGEFTEESGTTKFKITESETSKDYILNEYDFDQEKMANKVTSFITGRD